MFKKKDGEVMDWWGYGNASAVKLFEHPTSLEKETFTLASMLVQSNGRGCFHSLVA